jgi:hypothetical protein
MKNVLVIKGADFSTMKVETIEIADAVYFTKNDFLYKALHLMIQNAEATTFTNSGSTTYYGGFIPMSEYQGNTIKIKTGAQSSFIAFIKNATIENGGSFDYCQDTGLTKMAANSAVKTTVPTDADYFYMLVCYNKVEQDVNVIVNIPIET